MIHLDKKSTLCSLCKTDILANNAITVHIMSIFTEEEVQRVLRSGKVSRAQKAWVEAVRNSADCAECKALDEMPEPSGDEIAAIVDDPMGWLHRSLRVGVDTVGELAYLITFTHNPNSRYNVIEWLHRVTKEIGRSVFSGARASLEHIGSNIHCHMVVQSKVTLARYNPKKSNRFYFKVFKRDYGHVDIQRLTINNGFEQYIEKDMPNGQYAKTKTEFLDYYLPLVQENATNPLTPALPADTSVSAEGGDPKIC